MRLRPMDVVVDQPPRRRRRVLDADFAAIARRARVLEGRDVAADDADEEGDDVRAALAAVDLRLLLLAWPRVPFALSVNTI